MTLIYESAPELDETITIDPDIEDLHYDRTVDRHKVHRAAVSEVFLTDIRRQSAQHVLVAAQLPSSHSFFHDSIYNDAEGTPAPAARNCAAGDDCQRPRSRCRRRKHPDLQRVWAHDLSARNRRAKPRRHQPADSQLLRLDLHSARRPALRSVLPAAHHGQPGDRRAL